MQKEIKNAVFKGANGKNSLYDLAIPNQWNGKLIIFIHGYMGYKDWGAWNLVSDYFSNQSFGFLKYNTSHNGGTIENPIDFDDLDAFAENNYSKEVHDFEGIIQVVQEEFEISPEIYIIGHSRGGGIDCYNLIIIRLKKSQLGQLFMILEKGFQQEITLNNGKKKEFILERMVERSSKCRITILNLKISLKIKVV